VISMTGYAYCEKNGENLSASVEIKGYNSRYLEIYVNLPPWLSAPEMRIRSLVSSACGRGKIEIHVRAHMHNAPVKIDVNKSAAKAYYDAITVLKKELGIRKKINLSLILGMEGVLEIEKNRDDDCWQEIEPVFKEALKNFCGEREREGKHTEEDILKHLEIIENSIKTTASFAPVIENTIKENIKSRFNELLGGQVDENKVLSETASLLLKYTISEEISRMNSHLNEFRAEINKNSKPGKKLDFLCQEINREINTIGSKSAIIEVSAEVVRMKEALENIREQLRNVE